MQTETTNSYFLSNRSAEKTLLVQAEKEACTILDELKMFLTGDIGINIYSVQHVNGISIAGDLTVNSEVCRSYDPIDLLFLDLNEIMLQRL